MTSEEELKEFKAQTLKRARVTATVFGTLAIVALIALVYGFFQQTVANKARVIAEKGQILANEQIELVRRQLAEEQAKVQACEQTLKEIQATKTKSGK